MTKILEAFLGCRLSEAKCKFGKCRVASPGTVVQSLWAFNEKAAAHGLSNLAAYRLCSTVSLGCWRIGRNADDPRWDAFAIQSSPLPLQLVGGIQSGKLP